MILESSTCVVAQGMKRRGLRSDWQYSGSHSLKYLLQRKYWKSKTKSCWAFCCKRGGTLEKPGVWVQMIVSSILYYSWDCLVEWQYTPETHKPSKDFSFIFGNYPHRGVWRKRSYITQGKGHRQRKEDDWRIVGERACCGQTHAAGWDWWNWEVQYYEKLWGRLRWYRDFELDINRHKGFKIAFKWCRGLYNIGSW